MLAGTRSGITTRGRIWQSRTGCGYVTEKGAEVRLSGESTIPERHDWPSLGALSKTHVQGFIRDGKLSLTVRSLSACVFGYPRILRGRLDSIHYTKAMPWDHPAGLLITVKNGGVSRIMDGTDYTTASETGGLLVVRNPGVWETVHRCLTGMFD